MPGENDLSSSIGMDTTAFKAGVTELNAQIKSIETGFRASAAVMGDWSNTSSGLTERTSSLSDKLTLQKQKLETLNAEYQKAVSEQGATSNAAASLANQMFSAEKAISSTESDLKKYDSQLKTVTTQEKENSSSLSKLKSGFLGLAEQSQKSTSLISSGFGSLKNVITGFAATAIAGFSLKSVVDEMNSEEKASAQMSAVLKSTGDASGMTQKQLEDLADAQAKVTTNDKDTTEQAENMLLTFTGIGSKVFPQATIAAEDMATAMHTNATDAAKTLGKALNDPAAGLSKLTRQGVVFTAAQKDQITAMEKAGNVAGAQGVIIAELTREFGGSAKAAGSTVAGQIQIMTNGIKESGASILASLMPIVTSMMPMFTKAIQGISSVITAHKSEIIGAVSMVATVVKDIFGFVENHGALLKGVIIGIVGAMAAWKLAMLASMVVQGVQTGILAAQVLASGSATAAKAVLTAATEAGTGAQIAENAAMMAGMLPIIAIVAAVALLAFGVYELITHWKQVSAFFVGLWKTVSGVFVDAWNGIKSFFSGLFSWIGSFFAQWGPLILTAIFPAIGIPLLIIQHWNVIGPALARLWANITGALATAWNTIRSVIMAIITPMIAAIQAPFNLLKTGISNILNGIKDIFSGVWTVIKNVVLGIVLLFIDLITGNFGKMKSDLDHILGNIAAGFSAIWNGIKGVFVGIWQAISGAFGMYINAILSVAMTIGNAISGFFGGLWAGVETTFINVFNSVVAFFTSLPAKFLAACTSIGTGIKNGFTSAINFIENLPGNMYNWGVNAISSLISGVNSIIGSVSSAIRSGFTDAVNFIKNLPGEALQWGKDIINGIVDGIKGAVGAVGDAVKGVAQNIRSFLHFSTPDEGPLADFPTYMPDMMNTIVSGLTAGVDKVRSAAQKVAAVMSLAPGGMQAGAIGAPQLAGAGSGTSQASTTNVVHSGTIHVEGVSDSGQLAGAVDIIIDQLRREARI